MNKPCILFSLSKETQAKRKIPETNGQQIKYLDGFNGQSSYIESKLRSANKDNVKIVDSIFDSQSKAIILEEKLEGDTYQRFEERHVQKAFTFEEIVSAIETSNMVLESYVDADNQKSVSESTERILFVVRERGK